MTGTSYHFANVDNHKIFYREAGDPSLPTIILLHGFPTSSFMFRDLIPLLAGKFHVVAPDYIGFGQSDAPSVDEFAYSFDSLTEACYRADRPAWAHVLHCLHAGLRRPGRLSHLHAAPSRP